MNKRDLAFLKLNYESKREQLKYSTHAESMDISSSCYVIFGTVGLKVCKYKGFSGGKWLVKVVNHWKDLDWNQFVDKLNETEWEEM